MHHPDTILLSSLPRIITKVHVKYLSQRVYGFQEKLNGQTDSLAQIDHLVKIDIGWLVGWLAQECPESLPAKYKSWES